MSLPSLQHMSTLDNTRLLSTLLHKPIPPTANAIRAAFRDALLAYHPDKDRNASTEHFTLIKARWDAVRADKRPLSPPHSPSSPTPSRKRPRSRLPAAERDAELVPNLRSSISLHIKWFITHQAAPLDRRATLLVDLLNTCLTPTILRLFHPHLTWHKSDKARQHTIIARAIDSPPLIADTTITTNTTGTALTRDILIKELDLGVVRLVLSHRLQHIKQQPFTLPVAPTIASIRDDFHGLVQRTIADTLLRQHQLFDRLRNLVVAHDQGSRLIIVGLRPFPLVSNKTCSPPVVVTTPPPHHHSPHHHSP